MTIFIKKKCACGPNQDMFQLSRQKIHSWQGLEIEIFACFALHAITHPLGISIIRPIKAAP